MWDDTPATEPRQSGPQIYFCTMTQLPLVLPAEPGSQAPLPTLRSLGWEDPSAPRSLHSPGPPCTSKGLSPVFSWGLLSACPSGHSSGLQGAEGPQGDSVHCALGSPHPAEPTAAGEGRSPKAPHGSPHPLPLSPMVCLLFMAFCEFQCQNAEHLSHGRIHLFALKVSTPVCC